MAAVTRNEAPMADTGNPFDPKPKRLGDVLSEIHARNASKPYFRFWDNRLSEPERHAKYIELAKQLGRRYSWCEFDNYEVNEDATDGKRPSQREVFQQVRDFAEHLPERLAGGGGLVLFGRPGTGKDHLVVASAYSALLVHGIEVQWIDGATLFQGARQLIADEERESRFVGQFTKSRILIISDPVPPKGDTSQYSTDVLFRILDRRYRDCFSTWATLNVVDGDEAAKRLAAPIVDRLRHDALCLECNWPSYRDGWKPDDNAQNRR